MKLIKELLAEALKFRLHDIIKTPKGSGKVVRVFRNKVQVTFDKGPDAVFDLADLKPLNEAVDTLKKIAKVLKFPAGTRYGKDYNGSLRADWSKSGGHAGAKVLDKARDAADAAGFKKHGKGAGADVPDGSSSWDSDKVSKDGWVLEFYSRYGAVAYENKFRLTLTKEAIKESTENDVENFLKLSLSVQRKMYKAADMGHVVLNRKWKQGELAAYVEKAKASKK